MDALKYAALVLAACGAPDTQIVAFASECCACPPDAAPDAPPGSGGIDLMLPWTRTVLVAGTATLRGADGVAQDTDGCWWTPWEQSSSGEWRVTRACAGEPVHGWSDPALTGPEDVKPGDFDGDGTPDGAVAVALQSNAAVRIVFTDMAQPITLSASMGLGPVLQLAVADIDADGDVDVVFGTQKVGTTPGVISLLENPGPALARIGLHWTRRTISAAGWPMTVLARDMDSDGDMDVVVSDRARLGTNDWSLYGARWHEQSFPGWLTHTITGGAPTNPPTPYQTGPCSPYASPTCLRTPGDEMMISITDDVIVEGQSAESQVDSRILIHSLGAGTHTFVPPVPAVGHYQHAVMFDVDEDGDLDLVVSTWIADNLAGADRSKSWLYWLRAPEWSRGEISGPGNGVKGDNLAQLGRCVVTSEQVDNRGVELWCPPGAALP